MLGSIRRSTLLASLVSLAILGAGSMPAVMAQPAMVSAAPCPMSASKRGLSGNMRTSARHGYKGAGITMAQQQRASMKKRNVARNRRHHR